MYVLRISEVVTCSHHFIKDFEVGACHENYYMSTKKRIRKETEKNMQSLYFSSTRQNAIWEAIP